MTRFSISLMAAAITFLPPTEALAEKTTSSKHWNLDLKLHALDPWIASKYGLSVGYRISDHDLIQISFVRGQALKAHPGTAMRDVLESSLTVGWRRFPSASSQNYFFELEYGRIAGTIDEKWGSISGSVDVNDRVEVDTLSLAAGFGNRWVSKAGIVVSIDWIRVSLPALRLREARPSGSAMAASTVNKVNSFVDTVSNRPQIGLLTVQLGIEF